MAPNGFARRQEIKALLNALQTIGDPGVPWLGGEPLALLGALHNDGLAGLAPVVDEGEFDRAARALAPADLDSDMLRLAQNVFNKYALEISAALLLAALPQAYAVGPGAATLSQTTQLRTNLIRRVRGTAQFLVSVMVVEWGESPTDPWRESGRALRATVALRLVHEAIRRIFRRRDPPIPQYPDYRPLNQEELLGTLLTFTITVFEVLEAFGIALDDDEQEAYLYTWDVVGEILGIGTDAVRDEVRARLPAGINVPDPIRPTDVADARIMLAAIRTRQWQPITGLRMNPEGDGLLDEWISLRPGRRLTRALLSKLEDAMPPWRRGIPLAVMRELAPAVVQDRLALGDTGLRQLGLGALPDRVIRTGRFTITRVANPVAATTLRVMAGDVTRQAMLAFLKDGDGPQFVIPGLEEWGRDVVRRR